MIDLLFYFGSEIVLVRVDGKSVLFANSVYGMQFATIDGLKLDYVGTVREFPDLKEREDWKKEAIKRLKAHIKALPNEAAIANYIAGDLANHGYVLKKKMRAGFRPEVVRSHG